MAGEHTSPNKYPHGQSQLAGSQGYMTAPIAAALEKGAAVGRNWTRILMKFTLYEPPKTRGVSGRYVSWPGMRWKHDVTSVESAQHFARAVDLFVAKYQQDPGAVVAVLEAIGSGA